MKLNKKQQESIIDSLDLKKTIYRNLSSYGHVGREDLNLKWEKSYTLKF